MVLLYISNVLVLLIAAWAVWERRLTFGSRWDAPITYGIILFGLGSALDSPWPGVGAASFPLTGKYYLLMAVGHVCYLSGAAMGIKATYMRLMSDDDIEPFMRKRIYLLIAVAASVMTLSLVASPLTSTMPADHLYLVHPDGWLDLYWIVFLGSLAALELISVYGANRLRSDPRSVMVNVLIASQFVGTVAIVAIGFGILTDRTEIPRILVWPFAYAAISGGAVAAAHSWRRRVASLTRPDEL